MASAPQSGALPMSAPSGTDPPDTLTLKASFKDNDEDKPTAADRVINTVELLEMVLLNLPICQLFVLQRTNTTFRDTIRDSVKLQQHMFLAPKITEITEWNPLMESLLLQPGQTPKDIFKGYLCGRDQDMIHLLEYMKGISDEYVTDCEAEHDIRQCHSHVAREELDRPINKSQAKRALSVQGNVKESWRDIMMAHTPSKGLRVISVATSRSRRGRPDPVISRLRAFKKEQDITMGALFDWASSPYR